MIRVCIALLLLTPLCFAPHPAMVARQVKTPAAGGGGGPTTLFTDNFDRANSANPGANWTEGSGGGDIASNTLQMGNAGASPSIVVTAAAAHADTADVTVQVEYKTTGADGGPIARCTDSDSTPTMYVIDVFGTECNIYRHNSSGSGTTLETATVTMAANTPVKLEVSGTGATVTVKSYHNGTLLDTHGDTSGSRITTAGRPGVFNWVSGTAAAQQYDNFSVTTP